MLGWSTGAMAQCLRVVFVVAAVVLSVPVAGWAQQLLRPEEGVSHPVLEALLIFGAGVLVYVVLAVIGWVFVKSLWVASDSLTMIDRAGGAALGTLKAAVLAFFLVSLVSVMRAPIEEFDEEDSLHLRDGYLTALFRDYNLLVAWRFSAIEKLVHALEVYAVARRRGAYERVRSKHPEAADFFRQTGARQLIERERLLEAAMDDRFDLLLVDSDVRRYLGKPEFSGALRKVDWERVLEDLRPSEEGDREGREASFRATPRCSPWRPVRRMAPSRRGTRRTG